MIRGSSPNVRFAWVVSVLVAGTVPGSVLGQTVATAFEQQLAAAEQAAAQNRQSLLPYTWIETTQVSVDGDVKETKVMSCRYGPDGQVQRIIVSDTTPPKPFGLRGMIADKKTAELKTTLDNAFALLHQYVPIDPARIQAVIAAGGASLGQSGPDTGQVNFANYAQQGDVVTLTVDTQARILDSVAATTWLDNQSNAVTLSVDIDSLPDGTRFPATATLAIPGSKVQVQVRNSNYQKLAQ